MNGTLAASAYLPNPPDPTARLRLFCFHHAGGAASAFAGWQAALGGGVSLVPVQLPGRERRIREARVTDMARLVAELDDELGPALTRPYAFYGHSMGAAVAYDLAQLRARRGERLPERLLVGAYPAPHLPSRLGPVVRLPDRELADWAVRLGGMSGELLRFPEWARTATALLRDDLRICLSRRTAAEPPLDRPIDVFTGSTDPLLPREDAVGWARHTTAGFRLSVIPGGHFFTAESRPEFLGRLRTVLADAGRAGGVGNVPARF
ncbi:thioesterase II family protein [Kitasatospora sp. NPDC059408]|uniref:thioesterase II family protein n=1 Tax=Kitasatospora sp. NPDC059408 TaxID=3346823 RepID=UPI003691276A